jgi:hypothetical protein
MFVQIDACSDQAATQHSEQYFLIGIRHVKILEGTTPTVDSGSGRVVAYSSVTEQ